MPLHGSTGDIQWFASTGIGPVSLTSAPSPATTTGPTQPWYEREHRATLVAAGLLWTRQEAPASTNRGDAGDVHEANVCTDAIDFDVHG